MEPQIQYAKTSDGVNIAYYAIGQGPTLLILLMPSSHLEAEWQIDLNRKRITAAAQRFTVVRLDPRGFGLSDRDPDDFAVDSLVLDIEAVVDRIGLDDLRIYSTENARVPALAYTARHPEKVTRLVQTPNAAASFQDMKSERLEKLVELGKVDWKLASETFVRTINPGLPDQVVHDQAGLFRASIEYTSYVRLIADMRRWDVDAEATSLSTPTLLIHQRNNPNFSMAATRRVAGLIKDSRVAFIDSGFDPAPLVQRFFDGDASDLTEPASRSDARPVAAGAFRTVLFTDMVSSTTLTQELGDAAAQEVRHAHNEIVRKALSANGGSEIKHTGDGIMASFSTASSALSCAIAIQQGVEAHKEEHPDSPLGVYIGLNAGEPIEEDDPDGRSDLFGTSVDLAKRICDHAEPGQIVVSNVVRELAAGKEFLFADLGETELRGFEDPVRLYEVRWREDD